ncbi:hypothetical protein COY27_04625 [Candidatus Woesearchaeota archaeon CG_4_10_14_0_2_um_filter_33_13]|nr:MAG: hypothetical protein COY27_04625 [Candidatus Woesearchaeota archaeon CG_4_10_14_0_2_um_filter_33_13]
MVKIELEPDKKDKRVLFELEQDSRQPLQKIAKAVGLSKEAVFHRIKNLEKDGIIKKYITEVDIYRLGFQYFPILLKFQNSTAIIENEIIDYLKKNKYVAWLASCEGNWDINLTILAKSNYDLNLFLNEFQRKFSEYIAGKQIFITSEIHYFKRGFWLDKPTTQTISASGEKSIEFGDIDLELLKIISEHSRMPLVEIAERLNLSPKTVAYKIKNLEKQKVIQGSRILVDFSKLGYKYYKVWLNFNNTDENNWKKMYSYFKLNSNIIWATKLIGVYDLSIEMEVKDIDELRKIIKEIKEQFSSLIKNHESLLIFEEVVLNYLPRV